jgi:hypothetical protein
MGMGEMGANCAEALLRLGFRPWLEPDAEAADGRRGVQRR